MIHWQILVFSHDCQTGKHSLNTCYCLPHYGNNFSAQMNYLMRRQSLSEIGETAHESSTVSFFGVLDVPDEVLFQIVCNVCVPQTAQALFFSRTECDL